jgi:hypothetical protein
MFCRFRILIITGFGNIILKDFEWYSEDFARSLKQLLYIGYLIDSLLIHLWILNNQKQLSIFLDIVSWFPGLSRHTKTIHMDHHEQIFQRDSFVVVVFGQTRKFSS